MNDKVLQVVEMLPLIRGIYGDDAYIEVLDDESVIRGYSIPDGVAPQVQVGQVFKDPTGGCDEVLRTGVKKVNYLPAEVMGEPFEGVIMPIKDGSATVGVIVYSHSVKEKEFVRDMTREFKESMETITAAVTEVTGEIENLSDMLTEMNGHTQVVNSDVQDASSVIHKLTSNASRSNILALNASIEAARSGEAGRGFAVVASEMGKLATDSGSSAQEIGETLVTISKHLQEITSAIQNANTVSKGYLEGVGSVKEQLEKTLALANELQDKIN